MQLAEISEGFWPQRNRSRPSGMIPGCGARLHRRGYHLSPCRFEGGERISLGVELIGARACLRPVTRWFARADTGGNRRLGLGHARFELRADLEQHPLREAA